MTAPGTKSSTNGSIRLQRHQKLRRKLRPNLNQPREGVGNECPPLQLNGQDIMAQATAAPPDYRAPRQLFDPRGFTRNLLERRSWFIGFIVLDILIIYAIVTDPVLIDAWNYIWPGITVTIEMTVISFVLATVIGLITALGRISKNVFIYNIATFYVELFRGLPLLVIILIFSFALTPAFITFVAKIPALDDVLQRIAGIDPKLIGTTTLSIRDIPDTTRI